MADVVQLTDRFWSKTVEVECPKPEITTPCRIWTARIDDNGKGRQYGRFWYEGKPVIAYILSCAAKEGKTLEEMKGAVAMHACDNPLCVEHVSSGTQSQNMKDCFERGRIGGCTRKYLKAEA